jgi:anaerobic selenocysteine-containing dehydrogenase
MGAGMAAQRIDFGDVRGHDPEDFLNSRTIIIWGRNPSDTNVHLVPFIKKAKERGAKIVVIDPIKTASADIADYHYQINPSTDGALALGMANFIISGGLVDKGYIEKNVLGFDEFSESVHGYTPEKVQEVTGISAEDIVFLSKLYARNKPSSVIIGYGLQRYKNGGNNVRAIDALGALTGNIGMSGGGVNYANRGVKNYIDGSAGVEMHNENSRSFPVSELGKFLESADEPPVKAIFVSKANPLVQAPDVKRSLKAFREVEFKVVMEQFMTDTASQADIILPVTAAFEDIDIITSSMFTPYMNWSEKAVEPPSGVKSEFEIFATLAKRMGLESYPDIEKEKFLERAMSGITENFGVTLEDLKEKSFRVPEMEIPWKDGRFETPSGKFELYSKRAKEDGLSPVPEFIEPVTIRGKYRLRLITPHLKSSLHSQHLMDMEGLPKAFLNSREILKSGCSEGRATIESANGSMEVIVCVDESMKDGLIKIYEGSWHKNGSVNMLAGSTYSDMGEQATFYDTFCCLRK